MGKSKWNFSAILPLSIAFGIGSWFGIGYLDRLSYFENRPDVIESLAYPGALIASVFFPEGVHGDGALASVFFTVFANMFVYGLVWMLVFMGLSSLWTVTRKQS